MLLHLADLQYPSLFQRMMTVLPLSQGSLNLFAPGVAAVRPHRQGRPLQPAYGSRPLYTGAQQPWLPSSGNARGGG